VIETHDTASAESTPAAGAPAQDLAFLIYSPFPKYSGGRENWLHHIAPHLRQRGMHVRVIAYRSNRLPFYSLEQSGIEVVALQSIRYLDAAFLMASRLSLGMLKYLDLYMIYPIIALIYLRRHPPSRLVCMNPMPEGLAARLAGVPYVVSVRGDVAKSIASHYRFLERPQRWLEIRILRHAQRVLANGRDTQKRLETIGVASSLVPNGVDFGKFSTGAGPDLLGPRIEVKAAGRPVIAYIATMQAIKGADDAIECAAELKMRGVSFLLAMVGKGDTTPFKKRSHELGLDGYVEFFGETSSVVAVLRRASVFLGISKENGMSMSALEAMAAGVPVVARNVLTYSQLIDDGTSGLLGANPAELAECCARMLRDPGEARAMAARAQARARQYDWPQVAQVLLDELNQHGNVAAAG